MGELGESTITNHPQPLMKSMSEGAALHSLHFSIQFHQTKRNEFHFSLISLNSRSFVNLMELNKNVL